MKVAELKRLLAEAPDDMEVLLSGGPDHSYFRLEASNTPVGTVGEYEERGRTTYVEWYDERNASPGEKPVEAFVLNHGRAR